MQSLRHYFVGGYLRRHFPHLQRRLDVANAYQRVFDSPEGKIVLRDWLNVAAVLSTPFVEGDSHATAFNAGRQSMGLHALDRLRWSEGELLQLGQEITWEELAERERASEAA